MPLRNCFSKRLKASCGRCRRPAALEYGDNLLALLPGFYALEIRSGRLSIEDMG